MQFIFYSVPITCTFTQKHNKSQAGKNRTTSVLLAGYLGASVTTHAPSIAYTAYQPPTGQVLMHTFAEGPQHTTSPLSQLSLDFSKQKPLLSENLKLGSDKAGELPETDPSVYLAAAWQSPIPTVEAVRASHAEQPALFHHLTLIMLRGSHTEWAHCSFSGT